MTDFIHRRFFLWRGTSKTKEEDVKFTDKSVQNILAFQRSFEFLQD